jgi:hypothetical protein
MAWALDSLCILPPSADDQFRSHRDLHSLNLFGTLQLHDERELIRSFVVGLFHGLMVNGWTVLGHMTVVLDVTRRVTRLRYFACQIILDVIRVHSGDPLMVLLSREPGDEQRDGSSTPNVRLVRLDVAARRRTLRVR